MHSIIFRSSMEHQALKPLAMILRVAEEFVSVQLIPTKIGVVWATFLHNSVQYIAAHRVCLALQIF